MDYSIIIYIVFGFSPSLIWLGYYLRKDAHPEPRGMIIKIFLFGAGITIPVFFAQIGLAYLLNKISINPLASNLIYWLIIIGFSEEFFKYIVIRWQVINSPHLDEPLDIMLYMVIAALGFAALENILYLFAPMSKLALNQVLNRALVIALIRFTGATFLHTLCSAVVGYSLAISICNTRTKYAPLVIGILVATALHGLYDFSIMTLGGYARFGIPVFILIVLALIVFSEFEKLKQMKGVCKLN